MREHPEVQISIDSASLVAMVRIVRPPHNFLDTPLVRALADAFEQLAGETDARVIVLCSEGKNFCAGRNFSRERGESDTASDLYTEAARLLSTALPWVAAVQGAAVGGGFGLALAADFRVVGESARLSPSFARLGTHHGFGLTTLLPRVVGSQRASQLLMTGEDLSGVSAGELGLADRVVPDGEVLSAAHAFAERLAASAPLALRAIRSTLREGLVADFKQSVVREAAEQGRLSKTADFMEGTVAAKTRREPRFIGA